MKTPHILWMLDIGMDDVAQVGGKNASLGELIKALVPQGVRVPQGFCVTAEAYYYYLAQTGLDAFISETIAGLNTKNLKELSRCAKLVRDTMYKTPFPTDLGIRGGKDLVTATVWAMASLFTDRAISYRADKGFAHTKIALSVGVQKMVRSDTGASGVMFTVDTESGFKDVILINATRGLGELIVQGHVTPDEYLIMKSK